MKNQLKSKRQNHEFPSCAFVHFLLYDIHFDGLFGLGQVHTVGPHSRELEPRVAQGHVDRTLARRWGKRQKFHP